MTNTLNISPPVAAFALFSTEFRGLDTAVDFIFERQEDGASQGKMQHEFVGIFPNLPEYQAKNAGLHDDLELGGNDQHKICFICQQGVGVHNAESGEDE